MLFITICSFWVSSIFANFPALKLNAQINFKSAVKLWVFDETNKDFSQVLFFPTSAPNRTMFSCIVFQEERASVAKNANSLKKKLSFGLKSNSFANFMKHNNPHRFTFRTQVCEIAIEMYRANCLVSHCYSSVIKTWLCLR